MRELVPGEELAGKYIIEKVLGSGGMGCVYRAKQLDLGRSIALKVPSDLVLDSPQLLARFAREARTMANLVHENIVQVYEFVQDKDLCFIAMEYVEGKDLKELINSPPDGFRVDDLLEIFDGACEGLDFAHETGIIHRDIKPQNLMCIRMRGRWRTKIMDFGIARIGEEANFTKVDNQLTQEGQAVGTPSYMSPEQVRGEVVTRLSDLYSMGCMVYYAFTRQTPFSGSALTVAVSHLNKQAPQVRNLVPNMPPELDGLIQCCLAKNPANRPPNALEIARELRVVMTPYLGMPMADIWRVAQENQALEDEDNRPIPLTMSGPPTVDDQTVPSAPPLETSPATAAQTAPRITQAAPVTRTAQPAAPTKTTPQLPPQRPATVTATTGAAPASATSLGSAPPAELLAQATTPPKKNPVMLLAGTAVVLAALGIGIFYSLNSGKEAGTDPGTGSPAGTTNPQSTPAGPGPGTEPSPAATKAAPTPAPTASPTPAPTATPAPTEDPDVANLAALKKSSESATDLDAISDYWDRLRVLDEQSRNAKVKEQAVALMKDLARRAALSPKLKSIDPFTFSMGSTEPSEGPIHNVRVSGYEIGLQEVSALEFSAFLNSLPVEEARKLYPGGDNSTITYNGKEWRPRLGCRMLPANFVTWPAADAYAKWVAKETKTEFRLPTEAEWEGAARGNEKAVYPWSGGASPGANQAQFDQKNIKAAAADLLKPVDSFKTSAAASSGALNMSGNVAEWCSDWYSETTYQVPSATDPKGPSTGAKRVLRGGSAMSSAREIRITRRDKAEPDRSDADIGFRLARTPAG